MVTHTTKTNQIRREKSNYSVAPETSLHSGARLVTMLRERQHGAWVREKQRGEKRIWEREVG